MNRADFKLRRRPPKRPKYPTVSALEIVVAAHMHHCGMTWREISSLLGYTTWILYCACRRAGVTTRRPRPPKPVRIPKPPRPPKPPKLSRRYSAKDFAAAASLRRTGLAWREIDKRLGRYNVRAAVVRRERATRTPVLN